MLVFWASRGWNMVLLHGFLTGNTFPGEHDLMDDAAAVLERSQGEIRRRTGPV